MVTTHNLGFPRIGAQRELKFALEHYWQGRTQLPALEKTAAQLRQTHWAAQQSLSFVPTNDFSYYDHVLDTSFALGNIPARALKTPAHDPLDTYFRVARGRAPLDACCNGVHAGEMTKWFDTNYHYIVPELHADTTFTANSARLLQHAQEAQSQGHQAKPVLIGPLTYLWLGKTTDASNKLALLPKLLPAYQQLLADLAKQGIEWVQIDEPILVTELTPEWQDAFRTAYAALANAPVKRLLATYFGALEDNLPLACELPVNGLHLDAINGRQDIGPALAHLPQDRIVSLGVINGRNIWKTDLNATLAWLKPLHKQLGQRLWLAPSCSLLHVPVDLSNETTLDADIKSWLAFAVQKLDELSVLAQALAGVIDVNGLKALDDNAAAIESRRTSPRVHNPAVKAALAALPQNAGERHSPFAQRITKQSAHLNLPDFPTTTIGSFPQTADIRNARRQYKHGELTEADYTARMQAEIVHCIQEQEALGLDVLVHGEAERNDMVEYFGEHLSGYAFSQNGWVQSYGSRCVKPPILYGDISRPQPITVKWFEYAQANTTRPMKGMLTGPVTILNWSFVRDDQPRADSALQLALAMRHEVQDLERAGARIIQIDEAALREGLPLRRSQWSHYLGWAIQAFRLCANGVADQTQIHTHMCYSEFNDIIEAIAQMDADVITIETSRSNMELLDAFENFQYPNDIGPGVYDIHSPNIPGVDQMVGLMRKAAERIPAQRLWVNPDCGLKTRQWHEVRPALENMVKAAQALRVAVEAVA